ncbi:MAG: arginine deiminase family protein, partial [Patescibacteria group bacterium]
YDINPWMRRGEAVNHAAATHQWQKVYDIYTNRFGWNVQIVPPIAELPDMVFVTDCCLMLDGKILLSNFRFPERQPESTQAEKWLLGNGYANIRQAKHRFEGGDNLICGDKILAGYGFRSDPEAAEELRDYFGLEVVPLHLVDPCFYHLDTSVAILSDNTVAFYPEAIDAASQQRLRKAVPHIIDVTREEAQGFGLNAVSDGHTVVTSDQSESLLQKFRDAGFEVIGTPVPEFRKSGGGVKCMTLELRS